MPRLGEVPLTSPPEFHEEPGDYVYDVTLSANQELLEQRQETWKDSDFILLGLAGTSTGIYQVRFKLPSGRYWNSGYVRNANLIGTAQFPVPLPVPVLCPAGSLIGIDIKDLSGASNTVQLRFIGKRRYALRG